MKLNAKVAQAYHAMRYIGISEKKVKPVLKKLLGLYERNWELIEAENYRALADAIFEEEDTEEGEASSRPSNCEIGLDGALVKRPKEEQEELPSPPLLQRSQKNQKPSQYNLRNARIEGQPTSPCPISPTPASSNDPRDESNSLSSHMHVRNKGKEPISSHVASGERALIPTRASNALSPKNPASEPGILPKGSVPDALIIPKEGPFTCDIPQFEGSMAVIHPGDSAAANNGSSGRSDLQEPPVSLQADGRVCDCVPTLSKERKTNSVLSSVAAEFPHCIEIASSTLGEVKIYLSCNFALGSPNFHVHSPVELIELMEKRLRLYTIIDPNFSVTKLMQDMCECFLELVTNSSNEGHQTMSQ
ncbi:hypothetical protein SLEP1_g769 [Rubroshorea leprosula]|uniref:WIYLD domain-containing protein n=1 Tax=Rubroshorea leprosula TaxID=152421 RepID=A0AAV5HIM0_9ROSI|nr:hypothetical protein SLEP1_g769 [Rubroshorea leprosula]